MLSFRKPGYDDLPAIRGIYKKQNEFSCENSSVCLVIWQSYFDFEFCISDGVLYTKMTYGGMTVFGIPVTDEMRPAVAVLKKEAAERKIPLILTGAAGERLEIFRSQTGDSFCYESLRDSAEYLYNSADLIALPGKKYHAKRNHISAFNARYNWSYETLSEGNIAEVAGLLDEWYEDNPEKEDRWLDVERVGVQTVLSHRRELGVVGGLLRVDGKVIAVTLGSAVNDAVFDVSFEKALIEYDGAYSMINREFVRNELSGYRYINREDDMGLDGLRRSKLSYHPAILLEKYRIRPAEEKCDD